MKVSSVELKTRLVHYLHTVERSGMRVEAAREVGSAPGIHPPRILTSSLKDSIKLFAATRGLASLPEAT